MMEKTKMLQKRGREGTSDAVGGDRTVEKAGVLDWGRGGSWVQEGRKPTREQ